MINAAAIPEALTARPQWVCWGERERDGKQTKVPLDPQTNSYASVTDSGTWTTFEGALEAAEADDVAGVGFVFTDDDSFVGVDLDGCRDPETGKPESWARELIEGLDSFSEVSPSGTGYHVYVRGSLPRGGNRSGGIECYETARFFTVTGKWVPGTPTEVHERTKALEAMHVEHISTSRLSGSQEQTADRSSAVADEELLSKAMNAKNGPKFSRLWNGDTSGYDSHSEADMALCFLLAFWTGRDATQMDRLFRRSGLYRQKWDERHYGDGRTYGEGTLERAVQETAEVYEPRGTGSATELENQESQTETVSSESTVDESVASEVMGTVGELTVSVTELVRMCNALESQHEYLYEELQAERKAREEMEERVQELEQFFNERQGSWLSRLF